MLHVEDGRGNVSEATSAWRIIGILTNLYIYLLSRSGFFRRIHGRTSVKYGLALKLRIKEFQQKNDGFFNSCKLLLINVIVIINTREQWTLLTMNVNFSLRDTFISGSKAGESWDGFFFLQHFTESDNSRKRNKFFLAIKITMNL